ncbi:uridylate kinase ura6 [Grosmannia clavigera kw1407]|uniref:Uridylate kinase n=1 Tax=Grosmannia clavigera (strain kw1407 / UAMH 11150) TaxID=655863 RepID=F0XKK0_GROCL|nr:uridylate kinase ura6 [Grosmannia clavigera kw1407]EFX01614.1 uridylate kinase ura6 [Grosmannia clavigera kw1407]
MASSLSRAFLRRQLAAAPAAGRMLLPRVSGTAAQARAGRLAHATSSSSDTASCLHRLSARRFYSSNSSSSPPPPPPPPPPSSPKQTIKFWPFIVVIALGFGGYAVLVNQRMNMPEDQKRGSSEPKPTFSEDDVTVVFVLGGPGAGKGTQCARLVQTYGFAHLSAGDLLRAEQDRPGSEFGQLIKDYIRDGLIVPMEVTVKLLENAMKAYVAQNPDRRRLFLVDGFPRKMDQAVAFESTVCRAKLVLFYDCPESELERRLLERGKTSGRSDDNAASIRKRFHTFVDTSMPVVDAYSQQGRVVKIDATATPDAVFRDTQAKLATRLSL